MSSVNWVSSMIPAVRPYRDEIVPKVSPVLIRSVVKVAFLPTGVFDALDDGSGRHADAVLAEHRDHPLRIIRRNHRLDSLADVEDEGD
jgi:hypothetical protein